MTDDRKHEAVPRQPTRAIAARLLMWLVLLLIVAMIGLSIGGAQIGAERTARLFNSAPMAVLWVGLLICLLASPLVFPGLRRVGSLAIHAGPAMVLIGGLWGSQAMHDLRVAHLGETRIRDGIIRLVEGRPSNWVQPISIWSDSLGDARPLLNFKLNLDNFWLDLYEPNPKQWWLYAPVQTDKGPRYLHHWHADQPMTIVNSLATITPKEYLPHARAVGRLIVNPSAAPATQPRSQPMGIREPGELDAAPGALARWEDGTTVQVLAVYNNFAGPQYPDQPGPPMAPAVLVQIERPGSQTEHKLIRAGMPHVVSDLGLSYAMSLSPGGPDDPPGAWVQVVDSQGDRLVPIVPTGRSEDAVLHAWPAFPLAGPSGMDGEAIALPLALMRTPPYTGVRAYNAEVTVLEEGTPVGRQVLRVNQPMHYGGYHIYYQDYSPLRNDDATLRVVSDAGLGWVYAGFFVMIVGLALKLWYEPVCGLLARAATVRERH